MAELIANSYDADAKVVKVYAPMDELLAIKQKGVLKDRNFEIRVEDDGIGMTPDEINAFYLKVGAERREDPRRGASSRIFKRKVMGRKGLASSRRSAFVRPLRLSPPAATRKPEWILMARRSEVTRRPT